MNRQQRDEVLKELDRRINQTYWKFQPYATGDLDRLGVGLYVELNNIERGLALHIGFFRMFLGWLRGSDKVRRD